MFDSLSKHELSMFDYRNPKIIYILSSFYFGLFLFIYKLSDRLWYRFKFDQIIKENDVKVNFLLR